MLRVLGRLVVAGTLVVVTAWGLPGTASAQPGEAPPGCEWGQVEDEHSEELVFKLFCGTDDSPGGPRQCLQDGEPIPCSSAYGWWSNSLQCYLQLVSVPDGHPGWDGHSSDEGNLYQHTCPFGGDGSPQGQLRYIAFIPTAQDPALGFLERAIGRLTLGPPEVGIVPHPDGAGLVGLPVWMWTEVNETTWNPDPVVLNVPEAGVTLRVTAEVDRIVWDMGDGGEVVCDGDDGPFPEYRAGFGLQESESCGYEYDSPSRDQPGGRYTVVATTHWVVNWEFIGYGLSGQEEFEREADPVSVRINELQVLVGQ